MADEVKTIRIVVDARAAVDGGRAAQRALEQIERQTGSMQEALQKAEAAVSRFGVLLAASFSVDHILKAIDAMTSFGNALKVAGVEGISALAVQERLFSAANKNGVEIGALSQLYSRASVSAGELGASQTKLLQFIDGVTAALRVQGGSAESASGALLQLGQSLGSGVVHAEEFNSVMEGAFPIAQAAARGIDGMGGSVAKLRASIIDGKVTSQQFFDGLLKGFGDTEKLAASMSLTIGSSMTANQNAWTRLIGTIDKATGISALFATQIANSTKRLDELTKSIETGSSKVQPFMDFIDTTKREIAAIDDALEKLDKWGKSTSIQDWLRDTLEAGAVGIARWNGYVIEAFKGLPSLIGGIFVDAMNQALAAVETGLNKIITQVNQFRADNPVISSRLGITQDLGTVALGRLSGGISAEQYRANVLAAGTDAASRLRESQQASADERARKATLKLQVGYEEDERRARYGGMLPDDGGAATAPLTKGAGQSEIDKYNKLLATLDATAKAQDLMTAAADRGDVAFREQTVHAEALQKAIDIFGTTISETSPQVAEIEKRLRAIAEGKAAEAFSVGTTALRGENELLAKQIELRDQAPDVIARETAAIKARQQATKDGIPLDSDRYKARLAEIEQNETLKAQAEQLKASNELWTAPLRTALSNIQTESSSAFDSMLQSGTFTFQSLGEIFTRTVRRMAAEFLALATVRPVLTMAIEAIGPGGIGLIGGNTAAQLGFPQSAGGASVGSGGLLGGGGLGGVFNDGGASWLGGVGDWLGTPLTGPYAGLSPSSMQGVPVLGANSVSGTGLTWSGALGGAASIGMGAYSLATGRGSTGSMISGGAGILGGAVSMLGPMMGLSASVAGPIGLGIGLLGMLAGGLFGDSGPKIPPQPALAYSGGYFQPNGVGYDYGGGSLGSGSSASKSASAIATDLQKAFRAAGLATVSGKLIGGGLGVGTDHTLSGNQWVDRPYTETELRLPDGTRESLTSNDSSRNATQASEYLLAQAFKANVLRGGVSGAGEGLKAGLEKLDATTKTELDNVIALGTAYDALGKTINPAKVAVDKISASFDSLKDYATQAGLSLDPINDELKKQSKRSAQDFIDAMVDPLAVSLRALEDDRQQALVSAQYIRDTYSDIYVDMDKVATYYTNKEAKLRDDFYAGGVTNLQKTIDRLTYGDLANASPLLQLGGAKAAYESALGKATAGDATAITNLSTYAESYLGVAQKSFASSPEYDAIREEIRAALVDIVVANGGSGTSTTVATSDLTKQVAQLTTLAAQSQKDRADDQSETADLKRQIRELIDLLHRQLA